eukprot:gnl/MRDRNA2_/MRDRNA2_68065_c0_seq1.p1 gnl/MRDRNA2_/MRDRNA2_68065_c0~~gnl/MRDRNA2_/MRDRNA2_68065_c0_seq1.p1  ORF type:complete len:300 (+),score=49.82 gnl/MRDRNA2_/MRDRNA2_68065_c0_seq1:76-975(+)
MGRHKKAEIESIVQELEEACRKGFAEIALMRVAPDRDETAYRRDIVLKNFRISSIWSKSAVVLCPMHPGYCKKPKEAAYFNALELFDHELGSAGLCGISTTQLATIHQRYFGATPDFKTIVGVELRQFAKDNFIYDEKTDMVRLSMDVLKSSADAKESHERMLKAQKLSNLLSDSTTVEELFQKIWGRIKRSKPTNASVSASSSSSAPRSQVLDVLLSEVQEFDHGSSAQEKLRNHMERLPDQLEAHECLRVFQTTLLSLQAMNRKAEKEENHPSSACSGQKRLHSGEEEIQNTIKRAK